MQHEITFLDLTTSTVRTGQYWADAPLVTGTHAVWVVPYDSGRPTHVHKPHARHRDTQRALRGRVDTPAFVTGVRNPWGIRYDLGER